MKAADPRGGRPNALPVLLPFALPEDRAAARLRPAHLWLLAALALVAVPAWAQGGAAALSPLEVVIKWAP
ncbi:amino acid ABC transporter permease, partial [Escherichia coli]